jgi:hypothetical protein
VQALAEFSKLKELAEPVKVLEGLPKSSIIVLIAAKKVAEKASIFNFEAVYTKYKVF